MGSDVKGVYQLQGGVERYLQAFPEGGFWRGKNFVFDKREAIGAGNVNGDGGVVRTGNPSSRTKKGRASDDGKLLPWGTECAKCRKPWDRYVGKRKCHTCGVPILVCDSCMSRQLSNHDKKRKKTAKGAEDDGETPRGARAGDPDGGGRVRCPLCVEEGVTVPAEDLEYTDNGVRGRLAKSPPPPEGGAGPGADASARPGGGKDRGRAARSVLKWGGGHAARKREKRKFSRKPCRFGAACARRDCFFFHPGREKADE